MHRGFTRAAAGRGVVLTACVAGVLAACSPKPAAQVATTPALSPEQQFATLERRYVIFMLGRFPVVSTYLGGSEFDPVLADNDGR